MKRIQESIPNNVLRLLLLAGALAWALSLGPVVAVEDAHDGHDHAAHAAEGHDDQAHGGEAVSEDDPHAGHNHAEPEPAVDPHAGHDHAEPEPAVDPHAGHDHAEPEPEVDPHAGHDHAEPSDAADPHAGHAHAEDEALRLSEEQRDRFGIRIEEAGPGSLGDEVRLSGEVVFNEDRLVHLVPRVAGIARQVNVSLGDPAKAGDVLAVIDSADLASAKLQYFSAVTEVRCCRFELPRAEAIQNNVTKVLALLDAAPSVEELQEAAPGEMGEFRSRLIAAYAEYILTQKAYAREKALLAKAISSEGDFLAAETAFKKAQAAYFGARDSVAYEVRQNLLKTARERQLAEFQARTAEQRLLMLGLSEEEVNRLKTAIPAEGESSELRPGQARLGWYEIKAPFDGHIVQKHITLGEHVSEDAEVFTLADTDSVWVNLSVYARDLAVVHRGQAVVLQADHSDIQARGKIAMVTPFLEHATRSATARVILDNRDRRWIPGTFVNAHISKSREELPVVIPRDAVQRIEDRDVVFVEHGEEIEPVPVVVGRSDRSHVEIVSGLGAGTAYVAEGAFQLKATLITSNLDAHAGHGH